MSEQQSVRQIAVSGTDAAAICGVSKWMTPADCWLKKRHPYSTPEPTDDIKELLRWGKNLEPVIAEEYSRRTGNTLFKPSPTLMVSDKIKWIIGSPDFLVKGKQLGLEIKAPIEFSRHEWGEEGSDQVPLDTLMQCNHYMLLTGYKQWHVACLIGGRKFRMYCIYFHKELMERLLAQEENFVQRYIIGTEQPPLDYGRNVSEWLKQRWRKSKEATIQIDCYAPKEIKQMLLQHVVVQSEYDKFEKAKESSANQIKAYMKDIGYLEWADEAIKIRYKHEKDHVETDWESAAKEALAKLQKTREEKEQLIVDHTKMNPVCDFQSLAMIAMADMPEEEKNKIIEKFTHREPGRRPFHFRCKQ